MKRITALLLLITLLFSLCACKKEGLPSVEESSNPVTQSSETKTEESKVEELQQLSFTQKQVTIVNDAEKTVENAIAELSGDNPGLYVPSENYGKLYPFIGGYTDWSPGGYSGTLYGLTDKDGNIALPASAMDVWVYEAGDTAFYWLTMHVSQARFDELAALGKGIVSRHLLVREDGKKYLEFDIATDIEVMEDRIIVSYDISESNYEEIVIDIYDTQLNLIKRISNGKGIGEYSEGLLPIYTYFGGFYINKDGEKIFSVTDYSYLGGFHYGFASVGFNGRYGFINTQGEEVIPLRFADTTDFFEGGHAGVVLFESDKNPQRKGQTVTAFIDETGRVIYNAPEGEKYFWRSMTKDSVEQSKGHNISSYDFKTFVCPVCKKSGGANGIVQRLQGSNAVYYHNECSEDKFIIYDIQGNVMSEYTVPSTEYKYSYMDENIAIASNYSGELSGVMLLNSNSVYVIDTYPATYFDGIYIFGDIVLSAKADKAISATNLRWADTAKCAYSHVGDINSGTSFVYDENLTPILKFTW